MSEQDLCNNEDNEDKVSCCDEDEEQGVLIRPAWACGDDDESGLIDSVSTVMRSIRSQAYCLATTLHEHTDDSDFTEGADSTFRAAVDLKAYLDVYWERRREERKKERSPADLVEAKGGPFSTDVAGAIRAVDEEEWDTARDALRKALEVVDAVEDRRRRQERFTQELDEVLDRFHGGKEARAAAQAKEGHD